MEYMDLLPPTAPSLVFARETCTPYIALSNARGAGLLPATNHDGASIATSALTKLVLSGKARALHCEGHHQA